MSHRHAEDYSAELLSPRTRHEAAVIALLAALLVGLGYPQERITILSAYVGQLVILNSLLKQAGLEKVVASTVDAYQVTGRHCRHHHHHHHHHHHRTTPISTTTSTSSTSTSSPPLTSSTRIRRARRTI